MKKFLNTKATGWYFSAVTFVLALITLIAYTVRGGNYLSPVSSTAVTLLIIGLITNAIVLWNDFKVGAFVPLFLYAATFAVLLNSEMQYISNVAFGVDGNFFDALFFTFVICNVLSVVTGAVAAVMKMSKND